MRDEEFEAAKRRLTEKSIYTLIKDGNEVVSYKIENYTIQLIFFCSEPMIIEFFIDEERQIQARLV